MIYIRVMQKQETSILMLTVLTPPNSTSSTYGDKIRNVNYRELCPNWTLDLITGINHRAIPHLTHNDSKMCSCIGYMKKCTKDWHDDVITHVLFHQKCWTAPLLHSTRTSPEQQSNFQLFSPKASMVPLDTDQHNRLSALLLFLVKHSGLRVTTSPAPLLLG